MSHQNTKNNSFSLDIGFLKDTTSYTTKREKHLGDSVFPALQAYLAALHGNKSTDEIGEIRTEFEDAVRNYEIMLPNW
jgi:DNA-binding protein Fis